MLVRDGLGGGSGIGAGMLAARQRETNQTGQTGRCKASASVLQPSMAIHHAVPEPNY